jgi:hypothetical protein
MLKNVENNITLHKKFFDRLERKYNITEEEFINMDFKCCGIFTPPKNEVLEKNTLLLNTYIDCFDNKFKIFFTQEERNKLKDKFLYKKKCVCGVEIFINCFIYSKINNTILNIGSCCNKNFNPNKNYSFCSECNEVHNNRKNNYCNDCRLLLKHCLSCDKKYISTKQNNNKGMCLDCLNKQHINKYSNITFRRNCPICCRGKDERFKYCYYCHVIETNIKLNILQ